MITIVFENQGQHFTEWDIDSNGVVTDSRPYEKRAWVGCTVHDPKNLKKGKCLWYTHPRMGDGQIKYRIAEIKIKKSKQKAKQ